MSGALLRPLGFLLLVLGLGLRLDSTWQVSAAIVVAVGAGMAGLGLLAGGAFVLDDREE